MSDEIKDKLDKINRTKEVRSFVIKALGAYKKGDLNEAALYYEKAADISEELGHKELAKTYYDKAKSMKTKGVIIEQKLDEKEKKSIEMIEKAEILIKKGDFNSAAKIFEEAAELAPKDKSLDYKREANELFKKDKEMQLLKDSLKMKENSKIKYDELLQSIQEYINKGDIDGAIKQIERAAVIAKELGKDDAVEKLKNEAYELKKKQIKDIADDKKPKDKKYSSERGKIVEDYTAILSELKKALTENNYKAAFELYIKAGNLALQMGEPDRAELYRKKAEELKDEVKNQEAKLTLETRKKELEDKIKKLDENKNYDELIIYYTELIETLTELNDTEGIEACNTTIERLKLRKKRNTSEEEAKQAVNEKNFEKAFLLFKESAKISVELGENKKYTEEINSIKEKAESVSAQRSLIDRRSIAIANAKSALEKNDYEKAVKEYEDAAKISEQLGDKEIAQSYKETARRLRDDKEIIQEKMKFISEAEQAIKEKDYELASNYFNQVAKFCEKLSEMKEAEIYRKKASIILELSKIG